MRAIALASGKGGVGRTNTAVNLGLLLAASGKKTVVVDADITMANLILLLGVERAPISLQNVLMGEASIKDAVYETFNKMKYVPAELSIERIKGVEYEKLKEVIKGLNDYDFVIIDCPPGLNKDAEEALKAANELILILTPEPTSLADAIKIKNYAEKKNIKILGFITNMVLHDKSEIRKQDIEAVLGIPCLAEVPVDLEVRRSNSLQVPVAIRAPSTPFMRGMRALAAEITGETIKTEKKKRSLLDFLFGWLFRKKKTEEETKQKK